MVCVVDRVQMGTSTSEKTLKSPSICYFVAFQSCTCPNPSPHLRSDFILAQEWKSSEQKRFDGSWFWEEVLSLAGPME